MKTNVSSLKTALFRPIPYKKQNKLLVNLAQEVTISNCFKKVYAILPFKELELRKPESNAFVRAIGLLNFSHIFCG